MKTSLLAVGILCLGSLISSTAAAAEAGVKDDEILIGSCLPLGQDLGTTEKAGSDAYIDYVNNELHGVHGRKIRVLSIDDKFSVDGARQCVERLLKENVFAGAFFVAGGYASEYVKYATFYKVPVITIANGMQALYEPVRHFIIGVRATYRTEAYEIAEALYKNLGIKKFGAIYQEDGTGFEGMSGIKKSLAQHNLQLTGEAIFLKNATDVAAPIDTLHKANPDVVFIIGNYRQAADVLHRAQEIKWKPIFVLVTARGAVIQQAGKEASEGLIMGMMYPHPSEKNLPTVALFHKLLKKYQPNAKPDIKTLEGFVHAMLLVEGLKRAGRDLTREKLIEAYEGMKEYDIGLGRDFMVHFSPQNHQGFDHVDFSIVHNGDMIPITDWKMVKR